MTRTQSRHLDGRRTTPLALLACAVLLTAFTVIAWQAAKTKAPTYDESYHAPAGWVFLHYRDFRLNSQTAAVAILGGIPNSRNAITADFNAVAWRDQPRQMVLQWYWCVTTLYRTAGNDAIQFINQSRTMMLSLAVVLGGFVAAWAWRLRGAAAAVIAAFLFCFDPNFLAHSPLDKNDVVFSLAIFALMLVLWLAGQKLTWLRVIAIALLCGVMLTVKFSGILIAILLPVMLVIRAIIPMSWAALGRDRTTIAARMRIAAVVCACSAVVAWTMIWAVYAFRFSPTAEGVLLNTPELAAMATANEFIVQHHGQIPTADDLAAARPGFFVRAIQLAEAHRVLPQAWLAGLLFTYQSALVRPAFLMGELSLTGWWYYFPFAMAVKTPTATLTAAAAAVIVILRAARRGVFRSPQARWAALCLAVPFAFYLASAMRSNLNIGLRHVLPVYPFAFVAIACAAEYTWRHSRRAAKIVIIALAALLIAESLSAFPNYIPFFNTLAGGQGNGPHLLGDSNVDWGQDLALLSTWQQSHPDQTLYLSYFGLTDPAYYHLKYVPLPGGYHYDPKPSWPTAPGMLAISVSNLQVPSSITSCTIRSTPKSGGKNRPQFLAALSIFIPGR